VDDAEARAPWGRILVTGGTGFVGPKIVHALRAADEPVRCLVRDPGRARQLESWGCELARGDVTEPESLRVAVEGCERVVHLVAIIQGKPEEFERVMTRGTENLIAAAKAAGTRRFVLMSALGVNEQTKDLVPYFRSKWAMEHAVKDSGLEHVIFRPSFVFGRDGGVLPIFIRQVRWSPVVPVLGPGTQRIQPIWVEDVAAYFASGVHLPAAANRTFELGGPDVVDWNELYDRIKRVLGKRRPTVHVPFGIVGAGAKVATILPKPPITPDQVKMLQAGDNVASNDDAAQTFRLPLVPLDEQIHRAVA
jgi:uncharacterized protein YbjT (DUF2867 family)